jgi:hypothetical protein
MATYHKFEVAEHEERSISRRIAAGEQYTEATGDRETVKFTGRWAEMVALMESQTGGAGVEVSCDLERLGGGIGELRITREYYRKPAGSEGEEGGETEQLGTVAAPEVVSSFSVQAEPLLGHPLFEGVTEAQAWLLQQVAAGTHPDARIEYNGKKYRLRDACAQLDGPAKDALELYLKGVTHYYEVYGEATARCTGSSPGGTVGKISQPPAGVETPEGRDWLCAGKGKRMSGGEVEYSASYRMSGRGGWNKKLYS